MFPAFRFVPAQRSIRSDSLAHRARKPALTISKGPTGRPFAVKDHRLASNCRPLGPSTSCFVFASRADGPGYLNCWPFGPKQEKLPKHGVVSGPVLTYPARQSDSLCPRHWMELPLLRFWRLNYHSPATPKRNLEKTLDFAGCFLAEQIHQFNHMDSHCRGCRHADSSRLRDDTVHFRVS